MLNKNEVVLVLFLDQNVFVQFILQRVTANFSLISFFRHSSGGLPFTSSQPLEEQCIQPKLFQRGQLHSTHFTISGAGLSISTKQAIWLVSTESDQYPPHPAAGAHSGLP